MMDMDLEEVTSKQFGSSSSSVQVESGELGDCQTPKRDVAILKTPYVGMLFETLEEAKNYYEEYGRQQGFWIRTRSSSESRRASNEMTCKKFVCAHEGKYRARTEKDKAMEENDEGEIGEKENGKRISRSCSTVHGGCEATLRVIHDKWTTKWKVTVFNDNHNHKVVIPTRRMKMKSNQHMPTEAKDLTEAFYRERLQVGNVPSILGGAHIGFDDSDCYNHLRNVMHRELEGGDAQSVLDYFRKKQVDNPQFFYAIQCDENGRASNFFWVDSRSRMDYHYFGDVVTFDTTYRTNKYDMPFAPFMGVNHHLQSIQFGCALLQDETEMTFLWLFETWLQAMGGRHPVSIITDQDLAMKSAIAKVFPNTRHRLCLWHIKKKFVEKLSQVYYKKSKFKVAVKKCIWSTYKVEDFEEKWKTLIVDNGLEKNEWLHQLYEIRASWVPVYNRDTFFAGMNTTGCSEGINSFFDAFVTPTTNLREFVVKYEQALKMIVKRESDEDFESKYKYRIVGIVGDNEYLLNHAAKLYTRNVFKKFKDEWSKVCRYKVEEGGCDNGYHTYLVKTKIGEPEEFVVKLNLQSYEGTCECKNFEFVGVLCRHILKVFFRLDIDTIPAHFILARWRQEANKFRIKDSEELVKNDGKEQTEALRLSHMCQLSSKLACYAASSNEAYIIYVEAIRELSKKLAGVKIDVVSNEDVSRPPINVSQILDDQSTNKSSQLLLLDPNISQTKGRKNDVKGKESVNSSDILKSSNELSQKKKRKCALCKGLGHDKRTCPSNAKKQKIKETQSLGRDTLSDQED